jgi:NAD(P)-dependent dehydrogenase (short-subunit alcohol dehydrogenase family)
MVSAVVGRRVAVVTGAAGGMGRVIAARLADDGCSVAALDRRDTPAAAELRNNRPIAFYEMDVASRATVEATLGRIEAELGPPAVVVNAAAVITRAPFLELTDEQWDEVMDINLRGTFLMCQVAARAMVRSGIRGRIINISSNSQVMATPRAAHYAATKGGVYSLTRTLAFELARHGITANLICPGPVLTDMTRDAFTDPDYRAQRERTVPIGRIGEPEDIAHVVSMLASEASDFITGATLFVDGGQTLSSYV